MAFIFEDYTSMALLLTMNPNNFPIVTSNIHFLVFNSSLYILILLKNFLIKVGNMAFSIIGFDNIF